MGENINKKKEIKRIAIQMIISITALIALVLFLAVLIFALSVSSSVKEQAYKSASCLNSEISHAVDEKLTNLRDSVSVVCSDSRMEEYIKDKDHSESDDLSYSETQIKNIFSKTATVNEFTNYAIVYDDGFILGVMSEATRQFGQENDLYKASMTILDSSETAWTTALSSDRNMISYVVRLNDRSVFIASLDSDELIGLMDAADYLGGITSYICDKKYIIECTTEESAYPGSLVKSSISKMIYTVGGTKSNISYTVSSSVLCNGWVLATAVPMKEMLSVVRGPVGVMIPVAIVMVVVSALFIMALTGRILGGVDRTVDKLSDKSQNDLLTGLLNKKTFEEYVKDRLDNPVNGCSYALVFMDIDNFKGVNDRCGHEMGDEVLRSFAHSMGATFRELDLKGRLGGDEFAVLMEINSTDRMQVIRIVNDACRRFNERLHQKAHSSRQSIPAVTSSIGAAIWKGAGEGFEAIYRKADTALYASKEKGKDTWSIYGLTETDLKSAMEKQAEN